ncbi:hypothetical protein M8C21_013648 [Ambrosia artemisiifolia]|uniref:Uncharacterized protein n=1 Tax=Ambrosia artemisiifolia TaxID=4212 RepID=A0AAD5CVJ2_AMBAR|nr:hypothetical protein M8C21_013648 [Ambrosia artemisiifolia]
MVPATAPTTHSSFSCDHHPVNNFTSFCPECLYAHLTTLDESANVVTASSFANASQPWSMCSVQAYAGAASKKEHGSGMLVLRAKENAGQDEDDDSVFKTVYDKTVYDDDMDGVEEVPATTEDTKTTDLLAEEGIPKLKKLISYNEV